MPVIAIEAFNHGAVVVDFLVADDGEALRPALQTVGRSASWRRSSSTPTAHHVTARVATYPVADQASKVDAVHRQNWARPSNSPALLGPVAPAGPRRCPPPSNISQGRSSGFGIIRAGLIEAEGAWIAHKAVRRKNVAGRASWHGGSRRKILSTKREGALRAETASCGPQRDYKRRLVPRRQRGQQGRDRHPEPPTSTLKACASVGHIFSVRKERMLQR